MYVSFSETERIIGDGAKSASTQNPRNTVYDAKRLVGRDFNDPSLPRKAKPRAIIKFPSDAFKKEIADALSASKSGYVLESPKGPISNYECDTLWRKAYKEAGINSDTNREKACFHTLRHTGAIKMVKSGRVEMKEISVYLVHKSISVTERVYAKYKANFMKESASVMGEAINF